MPKIKIKSEIINNKDIQEEVINAIIDGDVLKYIEKNGTKVVFNYEDKTLIRENNKIKMNYSFLNNKGLIEIKELGRIIDIDIKVGKITRKDHDIEIKYEIDQDEFIYRVGEVK